MKKVIAILFTILLVPTMAFASTTYTVQKGDTMWKIASKFHVGTAELIKANSSLKDPNKIYVGEKLNIPSADSTVTSNVQQVIKLVNAERAKAGLKALTENWELSRTAQFKAQDMHDKKYFDHTSPTYGDPFKMMKSFGISYKSAGENIAMGQQSPSEVMTAWMNSAGHRANILNANYNQIGVGYVKDGNYWVQQFIQK
ncbi:SafA/ExsA family spore coat assembly protein [Priestia megaterium]|uniref:SafA/ExsA family spore coat assembly protein n=1 Tax=Priestia megaterium TaxID=1404 RepID=UPI0030000986